MAWANGFGQGDKEAMLEAYFDLAVYWEKHEEVLHPNRSLPVPQLFTAPHSPQAEELEFH